MPHLFFGLPLSLPPPHTHPSRLRAALGLSSGPADYKLMAGRQGCTLVKVTWAAVEQVPTEGADFVILGGWWLGVVSINIGAENVYLI